MMWLPRIIWFLLQFPIKLAIALVGTVMVIPMYRYKNTPYRKVPWIFYLWKNPEDWLDGVLAQQQQRAYIDSLPPWWMNRMQDSSRFWRFYKYHAIRNPADGLRNIRLLTPIIDSTRICFWQNEYLRYMEPWFEEALKRKWYWFVAWHGMYWGFQIMYIYNDTRYFTLKVGWKFTPGDYYEGMETSVRAVTGCSFASKFLPYREIS